MIEPKPNGSAVPIGGGKTCEMRVCTCCKDPKPRYFVRDAEGQVVRMALKFEDAIGDPKPRPRYDVTPEPEPEGPAPRKEPTPCATPSVQGELLPGETKYGI